MAALKPPGAGPVWKSFVDHVQRAIADYGQCLDVEIIGMDGVEGLERLQSSHSPSVDSPTRRTCHW